MPRFSTLSLIALIALSLSACAKSTPAPAATGQAPPAVGGEPAPPADPAADPAAESASETPTAAADPAKITLAEVTSAEVVSVFNSMGDRINIESTNPWPPVIGPNEWKVSFKPSPDAPMDLVDHLAIEVTLEGAPEDAPPQDASYSGGQSGGTLQWNPTTAGTYLITTRVMRKNAETGLVQFRVAVPAASADGAPTPAAGDAPAEPAPPAE